MISQEEKNRLMSIMPNNFRRYVVEFRQLVADVDRDLKGGAASDAHAAAFFTLCYLAMSESPNNSSERGRDDY